MDKRVRAFLDDRQKVKHRLAALYQHLESTSPDEARQFFREHSTTVFGALYDGFLRLLGKIQDSRTKQANAKRLTVHSKEIVDVLAVLSTLRQLLLSLPPEKLCDEHWEHARIVSILKWLLPYDSHPRLREEGAELVLVLLNAYANANVRSPSASLQPPHDVLSFYARLLTPLDERARAVAEKEMLPVVAAEQVVAEGGTPAVVAASSTPVTTASASTSSAINDDNINSHVLLPLVTTDLAAVEDANIVLLQMFITNIVDLATVDADALVTSASPSAVLADPATVSAATQGAPLAQLTSNATIYMLRLLMDHHLVELFPSLPTSAARHGDASIIDRRPRMLALLLDFIKRHVLHASRSPIAARVLNPAVLGGHMPLWRVLVDELVKEALLQPPAEMELVRAALQVFQLWTLVPQAEPLLLMPATAQADSSVGTNNNGSTGVVPAAVMTAADIFALKPHMLLERLNQHVRRCLESAFLVFVAPHNTMDVSEGQVALFRDVLTMVRSVAMESALVLDGDTWERTMNALLTVYETVFCQNEQNAIVPEPHATPLATYLIETILTLWTRSHTKDPDAWASLRRTLSKPASTAWRCCIDAWARMMRRMTMLVVQHYCRMGTDVVKGRERLFRHRNHSIVLTGFEMGEEMMERRRPAESVAGGGVAIAPHTSPSSRAKILRGFTPTTKKEVAQEFEFLNEETRAALLRNMAQAAFFLDLNEGIPWTPYAVLFIWKNLLVAMGNPFDIEPRENHLAAVTELVLDFELLMGIDDIMACDAVDRPPFMVILPWIVQTCYKPMIYKSSITLTCATLIRFLSRRQKLAEGVLTHIYAAIVHLFQTGDADIIATILKSSTRLFTRQLPGVHILLPYYLQEMRVVVQSFGDNTGTGHSLAEELVQAVIATAGTLSTLLRPYGVAPIHQHASNAPLTFSRARDESIDILFAIATHQQRSPTLYSTASRVDLINAMSLTLFDILHNAMTEERERLSDVLVYLLGVLKTEDNGAVQVVSDFLVMVAHQRDAAETLGEKIMSSVVEHLVEACTERLTKTQSEPAAAVILLGCLLPWVLVLPAAQKALFSPVLNLLDLAYKYAPTEAKSSAGKDLPKRSDGDADSGNIVKDAVVYFLAHLMDYYGTGPSVDSANAAVDIHGNTLNLDDVHGSGFAFDRHAIVQFLPGQGDQVHLLCRNLTGRYLWTAEPVWSNDGAPTPKPTLDKLTFGSWVSITDGGACDEEPCIVASNENGSAERLDAGETPADDLSGPPVWSPKLGDRDMIQELLKYIKRRFENHLVSPDDVPLQEQALSAEDAEELRAVTASLDEYCEQEGRISAKYDYRNKTQDTITFQPPPFPDPKDEPQTPLDPFANARLLLLQLGFLNFQLASNPAVPESVRWTALNQKPPSFWRDLKGLDKKNGRQCIKCALIYVGPGQEDEASILHNEERHASDDYKRFALTLGREVDVAAHEGYLGGLEKNKTNGRRAVYYANSAVEMIFHDVTRMPTDVTDARQLKKKRHVGNDHVHIVWNDNPARPYKPDTIGGDFGNVLLIIQPLTHLNLYSVHIRTDDGSPSATTTTTSTTRRPFGPLLRDCVVPRATLGELVRWTAVHAHRAVTAGELQHHPYGYRAQDVRMMTQRHRSEQSYAEVVEQVLDVRVSSTTTVASAVASAVAVPSPSAV